MKIDLSDIHLVEKLLYIMRDIYQHEQTNEHTKTYIRFVLGKEFPHLDIHSFLEGKD